MHAACNRWPDGVKLGAVASMPHDNKEVHVMKPALRTGSRLRRWFTLAGCVLGVTLLLAAYDAAATTLVAMDLPTLTQGADRVLLGTVEKVESHYLAEGSSYIVTDVTIRCERELLGVPAGSRFTVRHLGGVVGELGQRVHGEASYRVGEQVLLFAKERGGAFFSMGMAQGAMHVFSDSRGVLRVDVALDQAELIAPAGQAIPSESGRPLDDVLSAVRSLLAERARQSKPAPLTQPATVRPAGGRP